MMANLRSRRGLTASSLCVALYMLLLTYFPHPAAAGTLEDQIREHVTNPIKGGERAPGARKLLKRAATRAPNANATTTATATMCEQCCSAGAGGDACKFSFKARVCK
jgi:hypothetical protein